MYRNMFKLLRVAVPLVVVPYTLKTYHAFFWSRSKQQNIIDNRVFIDVEQSNRPCEDRSSKIQLKSINGYAVAVFDGHGGWQVVHTHISIVSSMLSSIAQQIRLKTSCQSIEVYHLRIVN